jgi:prevent-host-death family protein
MSAEAIRTGEESEAIEVNVSIARSHLSDYVEMTKEGRTVYLTNRGKRVAALVASDIAERHEEMEDEYWTRRAAEAEQSGTVSWDDVVALLESDRV